jgi:hypothetical protein
VFIGGENRVCKMEKGKVFLNIVQENIPGLFPVLSFLVEPSFRLRAFAIESTKKSILKNLWMINYTPKSEFNAAFFVLQRRIGTACKGRVRNK